MRYPSSPECVRSARCGLRSLASAAVGSTARTEGAPPAIVRGARPPLPTEARWLGGSAPRADRHPD